MNEPRARRRATPKPPGPAPDAGALHAAALTHLARYAATEAGLRSVLERRVGRWARAAATIDGADPAVIAAAATASRLAAAAIARRLVVAGAIDDAAFATARTARLRRGGKSRRAIAAQLGAKGIDAATTAALLPEDPNAELDAALAWCKRRRAGPFALAADPLAARRALAALARAGFGHAAAREALEMPPDVAVARLETRRQGG